MNLNKTNCFTKEWEQRFPNVAKHFKEWIDTYKKQIDWNDLFQYAGGISTKFHDVPIELQYGVICKWLNSFRWSYTLNCPIEADCVNNAFIWWCQYLEASEFSRVDKKL